MKKQIRQNKGVGARILIHKRQVAGGEESRPFIVVSVEGLSGNDPRKEPDPIHVPVKPAWRERFIVDPDPNVLAAASKLAALFPDLPVVTNNTRYLFSWYEAGKA